MTSENDGESTSHNPITFDATTTKINDNNKVTTGNLPPVKLDRPQSMMSKRGKSMRFSPRRLSMTSFSQTLSTRFNYKHKFTAKSPSSSDFKIEDIIAYSIIGLLFFIWACWMLGPEFMLPNGKMWSLVLIWFASYVSGHLIVKIKLPPLMGMLLSGIILKNLPFDPVQGLPNEWGAAVRAGGLAIILMRSGLELDLTAIERLGLVTVRLTAIPGILEAFAVSGAAIWIFGMTFPMALSLGFILAAVSPAVVVVGMFDLQRRGYGIIKGIPSLVVAAASFDDVVAISGFSLIIGMAVVKSGSGSDDGDSSHGRLLSGDDSHSDDSHGGEHSEFVEWVHKLHGVINIVGGGLIGWIGGIICSWTKIWDTNLKQSLVFLAWGMVGMYMCAYYQFVGAGSLGGLASGIFASNHWAKGTPKSLSAGPDKHIAHVVESNLAIIWSNMAQPLLFGVIGTAIDFRILDVAVIPKALAVIFIGVGVRCPAAVLATGGKGLTWKERIFIGLSWIPKATVQAALASVPLDMVRTNLPKSDINYDEYEQWGQAILTTAVFSIIVTAPIGLVVIANLGPKWLSYDGPGNSEAEHKQSLEDEENKTATPEPRKGKRRSSFTDLVTTNTTPSDDGNKEQNIKMFQLMKEEIQHLVDILDDDKKSSEEIKTQGKAIAGRVYAGIRLADTVMVEKIPTFKVVDTSSNFFAMVQDEGINLELPPTPKRKSKNEATI